MFQVQEMDLLSAIAYNAWKFWTQGQSLSMKLYCKARAQMITAKEMFGRAGHYVFVLPDSLPYDPNIRAVGINTMRHAGQGRLYIETTMIDWVKAAEKLAEGKASYDGLEIRGRMIYWRKELLLVTKTQQHFRRGITSPRTLLHTSAPLVDVDPMGLVKAADLIYGYTCFREEAMPRLPGGESFSPTITVTELRQEQRMELRQQMAQLLTMEQRPMMIQATYMQARLYHRQRVLRMGQHELDRFVRVAVQTNPVLCAR